MVPVPLVFELSLESVDAFLGVTPWTGMVRCNVLLSLVCHSHVWNMPPWVVTGMDGAIVALTALEA